jgi:hypothetical protein
MNVPSCHNLKFLFRCFVMTAKDRVVSREMTTEVHTLKCATCHEELAGRPQQDFNIEMLHYDDYVSAEAAAGRLPPSQGPSMRSMFEHIPFVGYTAVSDGDTVTYMCEALCPLAAGRHDLRYSTEMLRYDHDTASVTHATHRLESIFFDGRTHRDGEATYWLRCITADPIQLRKGDAAPGGGQSYTMEMHRLDAMAIEAGACAKSTMAVLLNESA